ncbi:unnamed protein product, partial [Didymodactylos carnosus]
MGKYDQSLKYFHNLLRDGKNEDTARIHNQIGLVHFYKGELHEALKSFQLSYDLMMNAESSPRLIDSARPLTHIGAVYHRERLYDKALKFYHKALVIDENFYGKDYIKTAMSRNNIGIIYYDKEEYERALEHIKYALEIRRANLPSEHVDIAGSLNNIRLIYGKMGRFHAAIQCHLESLRIKQKFLPSEHNEIGQSLINLGNLFRDNNQSEKASHYYSEVSRIKKNTLSTNDNHHPDVEALMIGHGDQQVSFSPYALTSKTSSSCGETSVSA